MKKKFDNDFGSMDNGNEEFELTPADSVGQFDNNSNDDFNNGMNNNFKNDNEFDSGLIGNETYNPNGYDQMGNGDFGDNDGYNVVYEKPGKNIKNTLVGVLLLIVIVIIIILLVKGCSGNSKGLSGANAEVPSAIYMGETDKISVSAVGDGNLKDTTYQLKMENDSIAKVGDKELSGASASTELTPVAEGKTKIAIDASLGKKKIETIEKTITVCKEFNEKALVTNKNISMKPNGSLMLTFNLGDESECFSNLEYQVEDGSVVSVDSNGLITANKVGTTKLVVGNGNKTIELNIKVAEDVKPTQSVSSSQTSSAFKVTSVTMKSNNSTNSAYAKVGDTITVTAKFNQTLADKPIILVNGKAATVPNGSTSFTASVKVDNSFKNGKVSFVIYNYKNKSGKFGNQVTNVTSGSVVTIDNTKPTCSLSKSKAKLTLSGKDNYGIVGYAINQIPTAANSYGSGRTKTATAAGTWYGHVKDRAGNIAHCSVQVSSSDVSGSTSSKVSVNGVSVSPNNISLNVGATTRLTSSVSPSNASDKSVTWSSNNSSIATVDSSGNVRGIKVGTAVITVKTKDGNKTATATVTVKSSGGTTVLPSGDTTGPSCAISATKVGASDSVPEFRSGAWTKFDVKVNVQCFDSSGVSKITYSTSSGGVGLKRTVNGSSFSTTVSGEEGVNQTITVSITATDKLGNSKPYSFTVKSDKKEPSVSGLSSVVGSSKGKITFKANVSDSGSGINWVKFYTKRKASSGCTAGTSFNEQSATVSGGVASTSALSGTVGCNYEFYVVARDVVGNQTKSNTYTSHTVK